MSPTPDSVTTLSSLRDSLLFFFRVGGLFFCRLSASFSRLRSPSLSPAFNLPSSTAPHYYLSVCLFNSAVIRPGIRLHPSSSPSLLSPSFRASSVSRSDFHAPPRALRISLSLPRRLSFSTFPSLRVQVCLPGRPECGRRAAHSAWLFGWLAGCWVIIFLCRHRARGALYILQGPHRYCSRASTGPHLSLSQLCDFLRSRGKFKLLINNYGRFQREKLELGLGPKENHRATIVK